MSDPPRVEVEWTDAQGGPVHWHTTDELDGEPLVCRTRGWLVEHDKPGYLTIAQTVTSNGTLDNTIHIPHAMIRRSSVVSE